VLLGVWAFAALCAGVWIESGNAFTASSKTFEIVFFVVGLGGTALWFVADYYRPGKDR
jgi:hypothetical protein